MIPFGFFIVIFSVCLEIVVTQKPCDGVLGQQFRPDPSDCRVYYLCGQGKDWRLQCGPNTVWNQEIGSCVPVGSPEDKCTQGNKDPLPQKAPQGDPGARSPGTRHYSPFSESTWRPTCRPGSTKRFPHPTRCAQYYDCGADPKEDWWGKHLRECPYPTVYDTVTGSCEYYTTVNCGQRKMPLDPCDYLAQSCRNAHCAPCHIRYATCAGLPDGINTWRGRENTPFYVVCQAGRVAFHGRCINPEPGKRQVYDEAFHTCGRPIDFEMGLVHHMHRGEMGKSEIVKQIHHAKKTEQSHKSHSNNAQPTAGSKQTPPQQSKPHINQPQASQPPQKNSNNKPTNNQQPPAQPKTPKPHINQPQNQNNQQPAAAPPSNNAPKNQPVQHAPHINQPPGAPTQGKPNQPTGPASHHTNPPHTSQPQMPIQRTPHANQPQTQAPVNNPPPQQQQYQPPPQKPQYNPPPQRPPQNYGPSNHPPQAQYPPQQVPNFHGAQQPHMPQQVPPQRQGPPYNQPQSQNKPPPQNPNSLQTFISEIQSKMRGQPPSIPNPQINQTPPVQYPNLPQPQYSKAQQPAQYQQTVRAKPGRRPPRKQHIPPVQPVQHMPRQPVVQQTPIQRHAPHPHPNQQRPPYSQPPQVQPLPPVQQQHRAAVAPMTRPVHNVPQPIRHQNVPQIVQKPNAPRPGPFPNSQQGPSVPYRQQGPPQPQLPKPRTYPQPIQRAHSHGPQPVQKLPVGPYPKPQLYNEPSTVRQAIGQKHPPRPTPPRTSQGNKKRRIPPRRLPKRRA
ncbi:uncharacterized protein LOC133195630 [Saccostrea echinata]|uniref:uncharacterized protein LOC133195630 n=1 Tax=Saccostrea echinata TaxID=191078 RepID=UPI002A822E0C|nr:uncharacterized protein LOC133195630 [Saccostrea echinata]